MKLNLSDLDAILEGFFAASCRETVRKFWGAEFIPARFHDELRERGLARILDGAVDVLYVEDASLDVADLRGDYDPRSNRLTVRCHKALCRHFVKSGCDVVFADPIAERQEPVEPGFQHAFEFSELQENALLIGINDLKETEAVDELNDDVKQSIEHSTASICCSLDQWPSTALPLLTPQMIRAAALQPLPFRIPRDAVILSGPARSPAEARWVSLSKRSLREAGTPGF